jgi:hypothetical protein
MLVIMMTGKAAIFFGRFAYAIRFNAALCPRAVYDKTPREDWQGESIFRLCDK